MTTKLSTAHSEKDIAIYTSARGNLTKQKIVNFCDFLRDHYPSAKKRKGHDIENYKFFSRELDTLLFECEKAISETNNKVLQREHKEFFRAALNSWLTKNDFVRRCMEKPRGYPGDYLMMEHGYQDEVDGNKLNANFFDRYFFDKYQSIIFRKEKLKQILVTLIKDSNKLSNKGMQPVVKIMTLGGGPAREWFELDKEMRNQKIKAVHLTYLDQDEEAMDFAKKRLNSNRLIKRRCFVRTSLIEFSKAAPLTLNVDDSFDVIYGLGIADYFHDQFLSAIIAKAWLLLKKGGKFILTHKDSKSFPMEPADWLCDWSFVHRSKEQFEALIKSALGAPSSKFNLEISWESSGQILFGIVSKN